MEEASKQYIDQILQDSNDYLDYDKHRRMTLIQKDLYDIQQAFEDGAKWADKTMIDKACEWLQNWAYFSVNDTTGSLDEEDLVKRFKKAMEE